MSKKDKYYQFPICLLTKFTLCDDTDSFEDKLELIASWTYANAGKRFVDEKRDETGGTFLEGKAPESRKDDLDPDSEDHLHIAWGALAIGVDIDSYEDSAAHLEEAKDLADEWKADHGEHLYVRIRNDIFEDVKNGHLSPRDFFVLCGLYAVIGSDRYKQITLRRIYYAAYGCKSKITFERSQTKQILTIKQVRSAVEKLYERGFFASVTYQQRYKYYSNSLTQYKLRQEITCRHRDRALKKANREKESALSIYEVLGTQKPQPRDDVLDEEPPF